MASVATELGEWEPELIASQDRPPGSRGPRMSGKSWLSAGVTVSSQLGQGRLQENSRKEAGPLAFGPC